MQEQDNVLTPELLGDFLERSRSLRSVLPQPTSASVEITSADNALKSLAGTVLKSKQNETRYRLTNELGRGGSAVVYQALELFPCVSNKRWAIKFFNDTDVAKQSAVAEAECLEALNGKGVVALREKFELGDHNVHVVELGLTLADFMANRQACESPIKAREATMIAFSLAKVCRSILDSEWVCRDIKPENIVLVESSNQLLEWKLCDLGFAAKLKGSGQGCVPCGTSGYMAPWVKQHFWNPSELIKSAYSYAQIDKGSWMKNSISVGNKFLAAVKNKLPSTWGNAPIKYKPSEVDDVFSFMVVVYELYSGKRINEFFGHQTLHVEENGKIIPRLVPARYDDPEKLFMDAYLGDGTGASAWATECRMYWTKGYKDFFRKLPSFETELDVRGWSKDPFPPQQIWNDVTNCDPKSIPNIGRIVTTFSRVNAKLGSMDTKGEDKTIARSWHKQLRSLSPSLSFSCPMLDFYGLRPPEYVGRKKLIKQLQDWLKKGKLNEIDQSAVLLRAIGGMGKSAFVDEIVRDYEKFFLNCYERPREAMTRLARTLISGETRSEELSDHLAYETLFRQAIAAAEHGAKEGTGPKVIVIDGVERLLRSYDLSGRSNTEDLVAEPDTDNPQRHRFASANDERFLVGLIENCPSIRVILTSRQEPLWSDETFKNRVKVIQLLGLDVTESRILWKSVTEQNPTEGLKQMFADVRGHPLTIQLAARRVAAVSTSRWKPTPAPWERRTTSKRPINAQLNATSVLEWAVADLLAPESDHFPLLLGITFKGLQLDERELLGWAKAFERSYTEQRLESSAETLVARGVLGRTEDGRYDLHPVLRQTVLGLLKRSRSDELGSMISEALREDSYNGLSLEGVEPHLYLIGLQASLRRGDYETAYRALKLGWGALRYCHPDGSGVEQSSLRIPSVSKLISEMFLPPGDAPRTATPRVGRFRLPDLRETSDLVDLLLKFGTVLQEESRSPKLARKVHAWAQALAFCISDDTAYLDSIRGECWNQIYTGDLKTAEKTLTAVYIHAKSLHLRQIAITALLWEHLAKAIRGEPSMRHLAQSVKNQRTQLSRWHWQTIAEGLVFLGDRASALEWIQSTPTGAADAQEPLSVGQLQWEQVTEAIALLLPLPPDQGMHTQEDLERANELLNGLCETRGGSEYSIIECLARALRVVVCVSGDVGNQREMWATEAWGRFTYYKNHRASKRYQIPFVLAHAAAADLSGRVPESSQVGEKKLARIAKTHSMRGTTGQSPKARLQWAYRQGFRWASDILGEAPVSVYMSVPSATRRPGFRLESLGYKGESEAKIPSQLRPTSQQDPLFEGRARDINGTLAGADLEWWQDFAFGNTREQLGLILDVLEHSKSSVEKLRMPMENSEYRPLGVRLQSALASAVRASVSGGSLPSEFEPVADRTVIQRARKFIKDAGYRVPPNSGLGRDDARAALEYAKRSTISGNEPKLAQKAWDKLRDVALKPEEHVALSCAMRRGQHPWLNAIALTAKHDKWNHGLRSRLALETLQVQDISTGTLPQVSMEEEMLLRDRLKQRAGFDKATGSAKKWWEAFQNENQSRLRIVDRLMGALMVCADDITSFFLSYVYSNTDNITANIHYSVWNRARKNASVPDAEFSAKNNEWKRSMVLEGRFLNEWPEDEARARLAVSLDHDILQPETRYAGKDAANWWKRLQEKDPVLALWLGTRLSGLRGTIAEIFHARQASLRFISDEPRDIPACWIPYLLYARLKQQEDAQKRDKDK